MAIAVDEIVADGRAKVISLSYGKCFKPGEFISQLEVDLGRESFARAALAGVSMYAASGDWGAFSCHVFDPTDHRESTFWPSCTDNVVSVGGTFLETREDGSYLRETGWQDYLTTGGTGGGFSHDDPMPAWQTGPGRPERPLQRQAPVPGRRARSRTRTPATSSSSPTRRRARPAGRWSVAPAPPRRCGRASRR